MQELAIIIPMFNEEKNADRCVRRVSEILVANLPGTKLIVVDDGSKDETRSTLKRLYSENLPFTYVSHLQNLGYGAALLTGMKAALGAGYEYGLVMDSDLTNDPSLIPKFAGVLGAGNFDLVKASRYISGGGFLGVPLYRRLYTIVGNFVAARLFRMGIKDCTNGFHAVRLSLVANFEFKERGFPFLLEELYVLKRLGARATEIPYILTSRGSEDGKSKFSYSPAVLWKYLKYGVRACFGA